MTEAAAQPPEVQAYLDAAAQGRLLIGHCADCGRYHHYPRPLCPHCLGAAALQAAAGTGTVYSYSVMRRASPPYVIAYVQLAEGPTMLTNIVNCEPDRVRIGLPVRLASPGDGAAVPMFEPDPAAPI